MKHNAHCRRAAVAITILSAAAPFAHAQNETVSPAPAAPNITIPYAPPADDIPNDNSAQTPGNAAPAAGTTPAGGTANGVLNPAQRREAQRQDQERKIRELMTGFGVIDINVQDALLAHIGAQVRARARVRQLGVELYQALRRPALADEEVRRLLADYQTALEADHGERAGAEEALNDRIHFRDQPRLEAMLMLFGIIGDNPVIMPFGLNRPPVNARAPKERPKSSLSAGGYASSSRSQQERRARLSAPEGGDVDRPRIARRSDKVPSSNRAIADLNSSLFDGAPAGDNVGTKLEALEGETVIGTVVARRVDGIDVRLDDGNIRSFMPRATGDSDAPDGGLDGEMVRVLATLEAGQRVRLRWLQEEQPRVIAIEKLDAEDAF